MCCRSNGWLQGEGGSTSKVRAPSLFTDELRHESPWTIVFADDIVISSESREQVEETQRKKRNETVTR